MCDCRRDGLHVYTSRKCLTAPEARFFWLVSDSPLQIRIPEREVRFDPVRKWRFDFAWTEVKVAVEIEGGAFVRGRHTRGAGYAADCEKYNAALIAGWSVLRFTSEMLRNEEYVLDVVKVLLGRWKN
jgi:very-short-patch-repair endonuclease